MAYLKVDKKQGEQYLRIEHSFRVNGKVVKKTLYSLGKVSDYTPAMLQRMGERFYELGGGNPAELLGKDLEELGRYNYGYYQVVQKAVKYYGLNTLFIRIMKQNKLQYNLSNAINLMLCERLHNPSSKRSNYIDQSEYLGIQQRRATSFIPKFRSIEQTQ